MSTPTILRSAFALTALGLALTSQAVNFFDDFGLAQGGIVNNTVSGSVSSSTSVGVSSGATRSLTIYNFANSAPGFADAKASVHDGFLSASTDDEVSAAIQADYLFATPADLSSGTSFRIDFLSLDIADQIHIRGFDQNFNYYDAFVVAHASLTPFSVTVPNVFVGVDATHIKILTLTLGSAGGSPLSPAGRDARITGFQAVPEPSGIAALGLGVVALVRRRKA